MSANLERVGDFEMAPMLTGPSPKELHPMEGFPQVCFIQNTTDASNVSIGDYTYYDDPEGAENFVRDNVLYHYPFLGDKLILGKFCALGRGTKFIMNGANHKMSGFSTYPFSIFRKGWETVTPALSDLPYKGDTVIGNDVWIGYDALIMPGVHIGDGAIIASRSVVTANVPPYTIVGGNPARPIRQRFSDATCASLQAIAWWNWPIAKVTRFLPYIVGADLEILQICSRLQPVMDSADIEEVARLATITWQHHYTQMIGAAQVEYMLQRFQSQSAIEEQIQQGTEYFLLYDQSKAIAYFSLKGNLLSKIYVHPSVKGQGFGKQMMDFVCADLKRRGLSSVVLFVNRNNQSSIAFYQHMGFSIQNEVNQEIGGGFVQEDYRMEKGLS